MGSFGPLFLVRFTYLYTISAILKIKPQIYGGLTKYYLDVLHSLIQQILSVIHNHFSLAMLGYYVNH